MSEHKIILKKLELADLPRVAVTHINSFPDSALTKLGAKIVERYYLWQLNEAHEKVWAIGAFVGDQLAGFSFSGVFNGSTSGFIERNKGCLVKETLLRPRLVLNPIFFGRLSEGLRVLRRLRKKNNSIKATKKDVHALPKKNVPTRSFGILSIAVDPQFQTLGIGQMLMHDAEAEAVRCQFEQMDLSVHPTNFKAVRFYEKLDWEKVPQGADWKGVMIKKLSIEKPSVDFSQPVEKAVVQI